MKLTWVWTSIWIGLFANVAGSQQIISASPDVTITLGSGVTTADEDVAVDNQLGIVVLENLGALSGESELSALGLDADGDRLLVFETTTILAGGVIARPGDVVRYDGAFYSIEFDASAAGLPGNVRTDAVSLTANGLLLSFDTAVDLGSGLVAADEDLVRFIGSSFTIAMDGSAVGLNSALDVDAAQDLGGGVLLMSFDVAGTVGGVDFADEDVVRFDGTTWSLEFDASAADPDWAAADLDAVMVPEPLFGTLLLVGSIGLFGLALLRGSSEQNLAISRFPRVRHQPSQSKKDSHRMATSISTTQQSSSDLSFTTRRGATAGLLALLIGLATTSASAVDGVIEINEASVLAGGITASDTAGYPATLDTGGSYRLTGNLNLPSTSGLRGIVILDGPVTLDLNGFTIRGPGTCTGIPPSCSGNLGTIGIEVSAVHPVRIENGMLTGLLTAINVLATTGSETRSAVLEDLAIEANAGTAVFLSGSGASVIRDCQISRNGLLGVDIDLSHPTLIEGVSFRSNGGTAVDSQGSASLIRDSEFVGNTTGIRSFFLSNPSAALIYGNNHFYANSTNVTGGTQMGLNICTTTACP